MKKAVLKSVMSRYMDLVEQSEIMKRDSVHKAIQRTKLDLLSQHKDELYTGCQNKNAPPPIHYEF